jgi:hypothetical protein
VKRCNCFTDPASRELLLELSALGYMRRSRLLEEHYTHLYPLPPPSQPRFNQKKRLFRSSDDTAISFARSYVSSYYLLVEVEAAELARELDAKAGRGG